MSIEELKKKARAMQAHINEQYQEQVAYVPDASTRPGVSVSKWVELPEHLQTALDVPGLPLGNISHIYGKPDCGKTSLMMQGIVAAQQQNILPILILTEHKFSFDRLSNYMGGDPEALVVMHADNIEGAFGYVEKVLRDLQTNRLSFTNEDGQAVEIDMTGQDCFIFLDSLGNTMSSSELESDIEDHNKSMGKTAKAIKALIKRVNQLLGKKEIRHRCGLLLINQSYMSMPAYGPAVETPYGGEGAIYSCVLNIRLRRIKDLKAVVNKQETVIGLETQIEVKKNHITHRRPISRVYTVASGMLAPEKAELDAYKKKHLK